MGGKHPIIFKNTYLEVLSEGMNLYSRETKRPLYSAIHPFSIRSLFIHSSVETVGHRLLSPVGESSGLE
jgi:hypothetical protein